MSADRLAALKRQRTRLVRPVFMLAIAGTLAGNVAQAQPTTGGRLAAVVAPLAYLLCSEILLRVTDIPAAYRNVVGGGSAVVGLLALGTSYSHLLHFAQGVGWTDWTAYTFPVFLDVVALVGTVALLGIGRRLSELDGGQVEQVDRTEHAEQVEPLGCVEQVEQVEQVERAEQVEQVERAEQVEQVERAEQIEQVERPEQVERVGQAGPQNMPSTQAERNAEILRGRYPDGLPAQRVIASDLRWSAGKTNDACKALRAQQATA